MRRVNTLKDECVGLELGLVLPSTTDSSAASGAFVLSFLGLEDFGDFTVSVGGISTFSLSLLSSLVVSTVCLSPEAFDCED